MNSPADPPVLRISSLGGLIAAIPHLLGFTPESSLVVVGSNPGGRVQVIFRYNLADPPDSALAADIAAHAVSVLSRQGIPVAVAVGYGPGRLVTPVADALRLAAAAAGVRLRDIVRVHDGRYWSYLCREPSCCPAEGVVLDPAAHPVAVMLAAAGLANLALDRALADTPGYSMALLLRDAILAGAPPSLAVPPLTPEQVAASYAEQDPGADPAGS